MKNILVFLILISTLMYSFKDLFTYAYFISHKSSIVKNICVQRNAKVNKCNGKCYLKKQFKKTNDQNNNVNILKYSETTFYLIPEKILETFNMLCSMMRAKYYNSSYHLTSSYLSKIFIPPDFFFDS